MNLVEGEAAMMSSREREAYAAGFLRCLDLYSIWKDGERHIGCWETNVRVIRAQLEREMGGLPDGS